MSQLAADTFSQTFAHLYRRADLETFLAQTYTVERQRHLLTDPAIAVWLLERDGEAIGHAAAGPCCLPHPDVTAADGELKRLYLRKSFQSAGWGAMLMQTALDWLLRHGPRTLWLGVWSGNQRAQRFYSRYGFVKAGHYLFPVGQTQDIELILRRPAQ